MVKYFEDLAKTKCEKQPHILINQVGLLVEKYGGTYEEDEWIIANISKETSRSCPFLVQKVQNIKKAALTLKDRADKYSHGFVLHSTLNTENLIEGEDISYSLEFLCSDMINTIKINLSLYNSFNSTEHPQTGWKDDTKIKELDL